MKKKKNDQARIFIAHGGINIPNSSDEKKGNTENTKK